MCLHVKQAEPENYFSTVSRRKTSVFYPLKIILNNYQLFSSNICCNIYGLIVFFPINMNCIYQDKKIGSRTPLKQVEFINGISSQFEESWGDYDW